VKLLKDCCHRECVESKRFKYWVYLKKCHKECMQEIFPKGLEDFSIKLRRDRVFEVVEEKLKRVSALKYWKKAQQCWLQEDKFREGTLCSFRRNRQGGVGWLESSVEDS
jgi:hypothetical protein